MKSWLSLFFVTLLVCFAKADGPVEPPSVEFEFPQEPALKAFISNYKEKVRSEFLQDYAEEEKEGEIFNPWSLDLNGRVSYRGKFWCLAISGYDYRGGAHGLPILEAVYFDAQSKKELAQSELLKANGLQQLSRWCREDLISQGFEANDEWMLKGTEPVEENFQVIIPNKEGVEIVFSSYQVAPYAAGTPSVMLSWEQARKLFKPEYL